MSLSATATLLAPDAKRPTSKQSLRDQAEIRRIGGQQSIHGAERAYSAGKPAPERIVTVLDHIKAIARLLSSDRPDRIEMLAVMVELHRLVLSALTGGYE